jgi:hypothetical protein
MPVKRNHYTEFADNSNELSKSIRLQMAHNNHLDYKKTKSIENARESMELRMKPFDIELIKQSQRHKI